MNTVNKTQLIAAGLTAIVLAGVAAVAVPHGGDILAGVATIGALVGMGALELKKRAY